MASLYPKKVGGRTYWYLREMARVDGKPKMVSERYLGTAAEIEALLDAREAAVLPERTRHLAFGDVAAAWGMLEDLGVAGIIDEAAGAAPGRAAAVDRDVPGAGSAEPAGRAVLEGRRSRTGGRPRPRTGSPRSPPPRWITAGSGTRCTPSRWRSWSRRPAAIAARIVQARAWTCSAVALDMTNFATFIATGNGQAPIAQRGQGQAEAHGPAAGRPGPGRHPGRRDPADLARLPRRQARRHPVPRHDQPAEGPLRGGLRRGRRHAAGRGHDRRLRRRAELRGELRAPGRHRTALHRVRARQSTART